MSSEAAQKLKHASSLFREGQTREGTSLLEEVQSLPSPDVVNVSISILDEMENVVASAQQGGDGDAPPLVSVIAGAVHEHYFACRVLRAALIRDWRSHWQNDSESIVEYLQKYLTNHAHVLALGCSSALLAEMCLIHSVIWKLLWGNSGDSVLETVANTLDSLLLCGENGGVELAIVGRTLAHTTIEEFGLYHPASQSRGLTLSQHEKCRKSFEELVLLNLTQNVTATIWGVSENSLENEKSCLVLIKALYNSLCWRFNTSMVEGIDAGTFSDSIPETLDACGEGWYNFVHRGVDVGNGNFVSVLDTLTKYYYSFAEVANNDACNLVLQTIVQFCCFTGSDWNAEDRARYADACFTKLFSLTASVIQNYQPHQAETLNSGCQGFYRLVCAVGCDEALFAHPTLENDFLIPLLQLTQAVIGHTHNADDEHATESLDLLLHTWDEMVKRGLDDITVRCSIDKTLAPALAEAAATVFKFFVREKIQHDANEDEDETNHAQEYALSHTSLIALLGRQQPSLIGTFLIEMLKPLFNEIATFITEGREVPIKLNEALWYVLTVAAKFIGDSDEGEQPCIPTPIINLAQDLEGRYSDNEQAQENYNEVFQLVKTVAAFANNLRPHLGSGLVSPGICDAIMQFCQRYVASYLFPDEDNHGDFCRIYCTAFNGGADAADSMLQFGADVIAAFYQDPDVLKSCCDFLWAFLRKPEELGEWIIQQDSYHYLISILSGGDNGLQLPGVHRGKLFGFLLSVCPLQNITETVIQPIGGLLENAFQAAASTQDFHNEAETASAMACLNGAFEAIRTPSCCEVVFPQLSSLIGDCINVVLAHPSRKPFLNAILEILNTIVTGCGSFIPSEEFMKIVEAASNLLDHVVSAMEESERQIKGMQGASEDAISHEEDERVAVLANAAKLVLSIATWGLMDMFFDDDGSARPDHVSQFAVKGFRVVINFSNSDVLDIPELRNTVFQLLKEVASTYTAEFLSVSSDDAEKFMQVVEYAVDCGIPDLVECGYSVMEAIASHCLRHNQQISLLQEFVASIAKTCSTSSVPHQVAPSLCNALFMLIAVVGVDGTLAIFHNQMSGNHLLAVPFDELCQLLNHTDFMSNRRDAKRNFGSDMKTVLATIRGTLVM